MGRQGGLVHMAKLKRGYRTHMGTSEVIITIIGCTMGVNFDGSQRMAAADIAWKLSVINKTLAPTTFEDDLACSGL